MAFIEGAGDYWKDKTMYKIVASAPVHNAYLATFVQLGIIYGCIYSVLLFSIIKRWYNMANYEYIYSYLFSSLFLGGMFGGSLLFCWLYILVTEKRAKGL
jgi:hypothetical protein